MGKLESTSGDNVSTSRSAARGWRSTDRPQDLSEAHEAFPAPKRFKIRNVLETMTETLPTGMSAEVSRSLQKHRKMPDWMR
jgi:hypothetical protein